MEKENVLFLGLLRLYPQVRVLRVLLRVRYWLNLIFTGVAPLISYIDMNFKIIFSIQFLLYNCFYFQCLLSQITVPIVFSSFNSINGFIITT